MNVIADLHSRIDQEASIAESQLHDYEFHFGQTFAYEDCLSELTQLHNAVKDGLSGKAAPTKLVDGSSVSELVTNIKALNAANTIDTSETRTERRQTTSEESFTSRIRRNQQAEPTAPRLERHQNHYRQKFRIRKTCHLPTASASTATPGKGIWKSRHETSREMYGIDNIVIFRKGDFAAKTSLQHQDVGFFRRRDCLCLVDVGVRLDLTSTEVEISSIG